MKHINFLSNLYAKTLQNAGGGTSRHKALIIAKQFSQSSALRSEGTRHKALIIAKQFSQYCVSRSEGAHTSEQFSRYCVSRSEGAQTKKEQAWYEKEQAERGATLRGCRFNNLGITYVSPRYSLGLTTAWKYVAMIFAVLVMSMANVGTAWGTSPYNLDITSAFSSTGNQSKNDGTVTINAYIQSKKYNNTSSTKVAYLDGSNYLKVSASSACITSITVTANTDDGSNTKQVAYQTSADNSSWSASTNMGTCANRESTPTERTVNFSPAVRYVRFTKGENNSISVGAISITYSSGVTHTVTAATDDEDKGTAAAGSTTVAVGATTTITATPKSGYKFDHWTVSGTGATLSSTTTNPTTLTMGTANATVTAYFVEKSCPSSGTLFSLTMGNITTKKSIAEDEYVDLADYATIVGGSAEYGASAASKAEIGTGNPGSLKFGGAAARLKIELDCELQTGDILTYTSSNAKEIALTTTSTRNTTIQTSSLSYIVPAEGGIRGSTIYIWQNGSTSYIKTLTITRPATCTAPSSVGISGTSSYLPGETISLEATPTGGSGTPTTYQWYHRGVAIDGATSATYTKSSCTIADAGNYTCKVTMGGSCSTTSPNFAVRVYSVKVWSNGGGSVIGNYPLTYQSSMNGQATISLNASTTYEFKVIDNVGGSPDSTIYYGNGGTIHYDTSNDTPKWDFGSTTSNNCVLKTGALGGGNFVFDVDITHNGTGTGYYVTVDVTYPKKEIYLSPGVWDKDGDKYAIYYYYKSGDDTKASGWSDFFDGEECGLYTTIPTWDDMKMIAVRLKSSTVSPGSWDDKDNQTNNITVNSNNYITITGWGEADYTYTTFSIPTYTISAAASTAGYGTVSAASVTGVACGTSISASSNTLTVGETNVTATAASATAEYTYAFDNWTWTPAGATVTSDVTATANFTRTPKSYTLTWDLAGGKVTTAGTGADVDATGTPSSSVAFGTDISAPTVTKTGYTFAGWSSTPASTMPAANTTYTATWTAKTTTITIDANTANHGSTTPETVTAMYGSALPLFTAATGASGYSLTGYFTADIDGTKIINADGTLVRNTTYSTDESTPTWNSEAASLTLYPQYEGETPAPAGDCEDLFVCTATSATACTATTGTATYNIASSGGGECSIGGYSYYIKPNSSNVIVASPKEGKSFAAGDSLIFVVYNPNETAKTMGFVLASSSTEYTHEVAAGKLHYFREKLAAADISGGKVTFNRKSGDDRWIGVTIKHCETVSCSTPDAPTATSNGVTAATTQVVSWTDGSNDKWDVYVSTSNSTPAAGVTPTASGLTAKTYTFTGLTASTEYYWWVRSVCDATHKSSWFAGSSFTTSAVAGTTYYLVTSTAQLNTTDTYVIMDDGKNAMMGVYGSNAMGAIPSGFTAAADKSTVTVTSSDVNTLTLQAESSAWNIVGKDDQKLTTNSTVGANLYGNTPKANSDTKDDFVFEFGSGKATIKRNVTTEFHIYYTSGTGFHQSTTATNIRLYTSNSTPVYTVTYDLNEGEGTLPTNRPEKSGTKITLASSAGLTKDGYTFDGWLCSANSTKYNAGASYTMTAENTTFTAQWVEAAAPTTYTVTYDYQGATGGNGTESVTQASAGANVTLATPTKSGYTFGGWYLSDGTKAGDGGDSYRPTANVTVYALWRAECDAVSGGTATFNFNDGTATGLTIGTNGAYASYSITNSKYQDKIPVLDSYFLGVSFVNDGSGKITITTSESYTDIQSISFNSASSDNSNPQIEIYTVDGDTETKRQNAMALSSGSTKTWRETAYTKDLSSTKPDGKVRFKLTTGSSGKHAGIDNIVIAYGGDGATCCYVTYNGNGATGGFTTDETAYEEGNNVTVAANGYTRSGYTFNGWNTAADGSGTAYAAGGTISSISGNVTLYAQWEEIVDVDGACWDPASTVTDKLTSGDVTLTTLTNKFAGLSGVTVTVPNPGTGDHESGGSDDNSGYLKVKNASSSGTQVIQIVTTKAIDVTFGCENYSTNAGSFYLVASGDLSTKIATCATGNEATASDLAAGTYYIYALPTSNNKSLNFSKLCISDHGCTSTPTTVRWTVQPAGGVVGKPDQVVTAEGADGTTVFTYTSANTDVATIVNGNEVHLVGAGTTYLIATGTDKCDNALESRSDEFTVLGCYTITYNLNGGAWGAVEHKETYTPMDEEYTLPTPTKDSYTFGGWYENEGLTEGPVTKIYTNTSGNKTYWAKWGTELSAKWSVTKEDSKLYRGGGGYSVTVYLNQDDWDVSGNKDDLDLSATEGVTLKNIVKSINGEGKAQVTADFDITTALAADATAITFTLDVPAAGAYVATELQHVEALNDCGVGAGREVRFLSSNKNDAGTNFADMDEGATQLVGGGIAKMIATNSAGLNDANNKIGYRADRVNVVFKLTAESDLDIYFNANSTGKSFTLYSFTSAKALNAIETSDYSSKTAVTSVTAAGASFESGSHSTTAGAASVSSGKVNISTAGGVKASYSSLAAGYYVFIGSSDGYLYGFDISGDGGGAVSTTLSWDPTLTDGGSVTKDIADPDFTYAAVKSNNSLGVVSYTSSNTSVATVNAAGKVHAVAEGTTTITATLPASGCFLGTSITYNLTVENNCAEAEGTITNADDEPIAGDAVQLSACGNYVLKLSGYEEGATIKWYKNDVEITGQTEQTLTVSEAGVYYAITHKTCNVTSANSITVTKLASTVTAEKVVDSWYVKNGRRTPDIALVKTTAAVNFTVKTGSTVIWNSDGTVTTGFGGCGFYLGTDGIIYLKGTKDNGDATTGLTGGTDVTLTITVSGECATVNDLNVIIHCQAETTRPSIAFVVDGTKKGAFTAASADHSTNSALYKFLDYGDDSKGDFDLTACNIYSTTDEKAIRQHYSQFDAILITDNPSTQETPSGDYRTKGYVNAFGTMIDVRPILTMEAYVSALKNWSCVKGNPTSPNPRQYALRLECKDHEIYNEGLPSPKAGTHVWDESSGDGDELYRYVILVDSTKGAYNGVAYNVQTAGDQLPALQGFTYAASGNMLGLGRISEGSLQAAIERQEETAARMLVFGINAKALPNALTEEGKQIIENILKYLLKTNMEEVDDCSNYFTGKVDNLWSNTANWSKNSLPTYETKARILAPCQLSGATAYVAQVDIASSGKSQRMKNHLGSGDGSCNGALTIAADGALVVAGKVRSAEAPHFATNDLMPTEVSHLAILSNADGNGTLIFNNEDGNTKAFVQMYCKAVNGSTTATWQYIGVPHSDVSNAMSNYYDSWLYSWSPSNGWEVVPRGGAVQPWTGYSITYPTAGHKFEMDGTLVATGEQDIEVPANSFQIIGNSWVAPIQIENFTDEDFGTIATKSVYLFNTGSDPTGTGTVNTKPTGDTRWAPGTYVTIPIHSSPYLGTDSMINSMQGFYVSNTGAATTLHLDYNRLVRPTIGENVLQGPMHAPRRAKARANAPIVAKLIVNGSRYDDRLVVLEREDFTTGNDNGWDGEKWDGSTTAPCIWSVNGDGGVEAVTATPDMEGTIIGFRAGEDSEYTFRFEYDDMAEALYLLDTELNIYTRILTGETYTFHCADKGEHNRFILTRKAPQITTGCEQVGADGGVKAMKFIKDDKLFILMNGVLYDATGKMMK